MSGKIPEIDLSGCVVCQGCHEVCPDVFLLNACGFMEVADLEDYPEDCIDQAINLCPKDCIHWRKADPRGNPGPGGNTGAFDCRN